MSNTLFTFIAQVVNFLILAVALWLLLFKRVRSAMKKRQESLQEKWDRADREREESEKEAEAYRQQKEELEEKKEKILEETRREAEEEAREKHREARKKIEEEEKRWKEELQEEKAAFLKALEREMREGMLNISEKVLKDLADEEIQKKSTDRFLRRLKEMPQEKKEEVLSQSGDATVFTPRAVDKETRETIERGLRGSLSTMAEREIRFDEDESLGLGVEVDINGKRLGWTSRGYLEELKESIEKRLEERTEGAYE